MTPGDTLSQEVVEPLVYKSQIKVPYKWAAGETGSRFFIELRDNKRFVVTRCGACAKTYVPPKKTCPGCFKACTETVEVGPGGTLLAFTQAEVASPAHPVDRQVYGLIRLDGADTAMLHLVGGTPLAALRVDMRVEAVFKEDRKGHILDIAYFKVIDG